LPDRRNFDKFSIVSRVSKFKNLILRIFLETPSHVNTATDLSRLPWHKYLKG